MPIDTSHIVSSFQVPTAGGSDTIATFFQILSVQSLHYFTLALFIPPFLSFLAQSSQSLSFEGGPAQVGMILDWREMSSRKTFDWSPLGEDFLSWRKGLDQATLLAGLDEGDRAVAKNWKAGSVWLGDVDDLAGFQQKSPVIIDVNHILRPGEAHLPGSSMLNPAGQKNDGGSGADAGALQAQMQSEIGDTGGTAAETNLEQWEWKITRDPSRGWAIAAAWAVACAVDVFLLTTVVRRPKHILDHVATMHLVNLLLTSWYSSSIPTSLFWWFVIFAHGAACVLWAERVAIVREMSTSVGHGLVGSGREEPSMLSAFQSEGDEEAGGPHVLFDGDENGQANGDGEDERASMIKKPQMFLVGGPPRQNGRSKEEDAIEMKKLRNP